MSKRLLTISSAVGLALAGTVSLAPSAGASTATPSAAATASIAVPVTCRFTPSVDITPAFTLTVDLKAPAAVRAHRRFTIEARVSSPPQQTVPVSLLGLGFTTTITATGARPAGPIELIQAPVDVPQGGSVAPELFRRRLTAGAAGSTITYTLDGFSYTFAHAGNPDLRITSTCTPTTGGPVTLATTRVRR